MTIGRKIFAQSYIPLGSLICLLVGTYCGFAFISMPFGISVGLDPSWTYAISKAASEQLIFGRDIIFTFGSLGYLIKGAVIEDNFWSITAFRLITHFTLFTVTLVRLVTLKDNVTKLALGVGVLAIYVTDLGTDYQILYIFLILLFSRFVFETKYTRPLILGLSVISGFCLLTKFTLGIYTTGSIVLLLSANIYCTIRARANIKDKCFFLLESLLVLISTALIFLNPSLYIINLAKATICCIVSLIIVLIIQLVLKSTILNQNKIINILDELTLTRVGFYLFYTSGLLLLNHDLFLSLIDYLKSSWEISSGYSSAMSTIGPQWQLIVGISQIILISILLYLVLQKGRLGLSLVLAFVLFLSFKHGFVRQDEGHVFIFFSITPFITSLCIIAQGNKSKNISQVFAVLVQMYAIFILLFTTHFQSAFLLKLTPTNVFNNFTSLLNLTQVRSQITSNSKVNLSEVKLPTQVVETIKDKQIDIVPWEISLVEANHLNWRPRPIFQSYSAYTSFLDKKNSQSLLKKTPDYIIYQFTAIDGRHPFFDEPETFFNIFCNYRLSSDIPHFVSTPKVTNFIILEKRSSNICSSNTVSQKVSVSWQTIHSIDTQNSSLVRAAIRINYSLLGKIYKTLFRSPPVKIDVSYANGQSNSYRIIPENAENGVILSYLPSNDREALSFFGGFLPIPVESFRFLTKNPLLYKPNIKIDLIPVKFSDSSIRQIESIQLKNIKNVNFLDKELDVIGYFESKNNKPDKPLKKGERIKLSGWGTHTLKYADTTWVLITYGTHRRPLAITKANLPRHDVAETIDSRYLNSGWSITVTTQGIPKGVHDLTAWIYDPVQNYALPISGSYRVKVN